MADRPSKAHCRISCDRLRTQGLRGDVANVAASTPGRKADRCPGRVDNVLLFDIMLSMAHGTVHLALYNTLADYEVGHLLAELHTGRFTGTRFDVVTVAESAPSRSRRWAECAWRRHAARRAHARRQRPPCLGRSDDMGRRQGTGIRCRGGKLPRRPSPGGGDVGARLGLARAGLLDNRDHTTAPRLNTSRQPDMRAASTASTSARVVQGGDLITAGPQSPCSSRARRCSVSGWPLSARSRPTKASSTVATRPRFRCSCKGSAPRERRRKRRRRPATRALARPANPHGSRPTADRRHRRRVPAQRPAAGDRATARGRGELAADVVAGARRRSRRTAYGGGDRALDGNNPPRGAARRRPARRARLAGVPPQPEPSSSQACRLHRSQILGHPPHRARPTPLGQPDRGEIGQGGAPATHWPP